jgi:hypothetical protein
LVRDSRLGVDRDTDRDLPSTVRAALDHLYEACEACSYLGPTSHPRARRWFRSDRAVHRQPTSVVDRSVRQPVRCRDPDRRSIARSGAHDERAPGDLG